MIELIPIGMKTNNWTWHRSRFSTQSLPVADTGFSRRGGGGATPKVGAPIYYFAQFSPKTAWKWKNLDTERGASLTPHSYPPMITTFIEAAPIGWCRLLLAELVFREFFSELQKEFMTPSPRLLYPPPLISTIWQYYAKCCLAKLRLGIE